MERFHIRIQISGFSYEIGGSGSARPASLGQVSAWVPPGLCNRRQWGSQGWEMMRGAATGPRVAGFGAGPPRELELGSSPLLFPHMPRPPGWLRWSQSLVSCAGFRGRASVSLFCTGVTMEFWLLLKNTFLANIHLALVIYQVPDWCGFTESSQQPRDGGAVVTPISQMGKSMPRG